jgi:hypothetical protein
MSHTVRRVETAAVKKLHPSRYEVAKPCVYHDVTNVVPVNQPPTAKYAGGNNNKPDQRKRIYLSLTNHLQDQNATFLVLPNIWSYFYNPLI